MAVPPMVLNAAVTSPGAAVLAQHTTSIDPVFGNGQSRVGETDIPRIQFIVDDGQDRDAKVRQLRRRPQRRRDHRGRPALSGGVQQGQENCFIAFGHRVIGEAHGEHLRGDAGGKAQRAGGVGVIRTLGRLQETGFSYGRIVNADLAGRAAQSADLNVRGRDTLTDTA